MRLIPEHTKIRIGLNKISATTKIEFEPPKTPEIVRIYFAGNGTLTLLLSCSLDLLLPYFLSLFLLDARGHVSGNTALL